MQNREMIGVTDLKVINEAPCQAASYIYAFAQRDEYSFHVIMVIARSYRVVKNILEQLFLTFERLGEAKFSHRER